LYASEVRKATLITTLVGVILWGCTAHSDAPSVTGVQDSGGGGLIFNNHAVLFPECDAAQLSHAARDAGAEDSGGANGDASRCVASAGVQFSRDVKPLFRNCSGEVCHTDTWGSGDPYPFLVGVKATECCDGRLRVAPHDPQGSYVIEKLTGRSMCRGSQMPLGSHFDDAEIRTISDWICLGAPND
jgi:hypothetical protein